MYPSATRSERFRGAQSRTIPTPTQELTFPTGSSDVTISAEAMRIEALTKVAEGGEVGAEVADAQPVVPLFLDRNDSRAPAPTSRSLLMPFGVVIFFGGDVKFFGTSVGGVGVERTCS